MMRSKLFVGLLLCAIAVHGASPRELYDKHRQEILAGACICLEETCFVIGKAPLRVHKPRAIKNAKQQAELDATANLITYCRLSQTTFPDMISAEEKKLISCHLLPFISSSAHLHGAQTIDTFIEDDTATAVLALPRADRTSFPPLTFEEILPILLSKEAIFDTACPLPLELLQRLFQLRGPLPQPLDHTPWENILASAPITSPFLQRLHVLAGNLPIGNTLPIGDNHAYNAGLRAYRRRDFETAYAHFLQATATSLSFEAFNMAGNTARRLNRNAEAVLLLLHAAYLNSTSAYPWIHLAYVAEQCGDEALKEQCCSEAERRNPDAWSQKQLHLLRQPKPPPPEHIDKAPTPKDTSTPKPERLIPDE